MRQSSAVSSHASAGKAGHSSTRSSKTASARSPHRSTTATATLSPRSTSLSTPIRGRWRRSARTSSRACSTPRPRSSRTSSLRGRRPAALTPPGSRLREPRPATGRAPRHRGGRPAQPAKGGGVRPLYNCARRCGDASVPAGTQAGRYSGRQVLSPPRRSGRRADGAGWVGEVLRPACAVGAPTRKGRCNRPPRRLPAVRALRRARDTPHFAPVCRQAAAHRSGTAGAPRPTRYRARLRRYALQVVAHRSGSSRPDASSLCTTWLCGAVFTISGSE